MFKLASIVGIQQGYTFLHTWSHMIGFCHIRCCSVNVIIYAGRVPPHEYHKCVGTWLYSTGNIIILTTCYCFNHIALDYTNLASWFFVVWPDTWNQFCKMYPHISSIQGQYFPYYFAHMQIHAPTMFMEGIDCVILCITFTSGSLWYRSGIYWLNEAIPFGVSLIHLQSFS